MKSSLACLGIVTYLLSQFGTVQVLAKDTQESLDTKQFVAEWLKNCQSLKQQPTDLSSNVVYSQRPQQPPLGQFWVIKLSNGTSIPVPPIHYDDVTVYRSSSDEPPSLFLFAKGKVLIALSHIDSSTWVFNDVFATIKHGNSVVGRKLTEEMFGGSVSFVQLKDLGFRHRWQDLSCATDRWKAEVPIALAVSLKRPSDAAYPNTANNAGILSVSQSDRKIQWNAIAPHPKFITQIDITVSQPSSFSDIGLGIGRTDLSLAANHPTWLDKLEVAMNQDEVVSWKALEGR